MSTAQLLFPDVDLPPEQAEVGLFAQVVFNRPVSHGFSYAIPPALEEQVIPGKRLIVPFGRGNAQAIGYCVEVTRQKPERKVKPITRVLDHDPLFTPSLLKLTRWLADYYFCGWGQALDAIIPAAAKTRAGSRERDFITALPDPLLPVAARLGKKQHLALEYLRAHPGVHEVHQVADAVPCSLAVLWALVERGYAQRSKRRIETYPVSRAPQPPFQHLVLNAKQQEAFDAIAARIDEGGFHTFLLYGVTGSGKTEVYLQAIDKVVQAGKQALVLVPEISLTPQAVQRFKARFGSVAVLHSQLTDADRGSHWRRIASGMVPVIVGARSAVFAPTAKLGLVIVDEEHEGSFKQESTPRYHARDLAIVRAQLENVPIVLGSATPSLESWNNARKGTFTLLELPDRVGNKPMPPVGIIDMRHEKLTPGMYNAISPSLEEAMRKALGAGGQVILLLNRRGFDTCLFCPDCGQVVKCKFCDVVMTYHRQGKSRPSQFMVKSDRSSGQGELTGKAVCHYCGYEMDPPKKCPGCDIGRLRYFGLGTEKLEEELARKFPDISAARMDADAMRRTGSHEKTFLAFQQGEIRILFGTQMIAKGLDIPTVTLVGVIYADLALHLPDFRAAERTFQLLAQVAGRAGRGEHGGKVLVQTYHPEHPCIKLASKHDFRAFAESELGTRQVHGFPPIGRLARIIIRGRSEKKVQRFAESWAQELTPYVDANLKVLGPAQAPLKKLEGWYRHHLLVVSATSKRLHAALTAVKAKFEHADDLEFSIDVDPMNML